MRVMILGANGVVGTALRQVLWSEDVHAFGRKDVDVTDAHRVNVVLREVKPDFCINCAGLTNVEQLEMQPLFESTFVNGIAVGRIAKACQRTGTCLVHLSTDYVFGQEWQQGYCERDEPQRPLNRYGKSKLVGERLLREQGGSYYLVRTSWVFGPNGYNFADKVIKLGRERTWLSAPEDQWGNPTYSFDLARAIYSLLRDVPPAGIYHLTNGPSTTPFAFAQSVLKMCHIDARLAPTQGTPAYQAQRPRCRTLFNTKRPLLRHWHLGLRDYLVGIGEINNRI